MAVNIDQINAEFQSLKEDWRGRFDYKKPKELYFCRDNNHNYHRNNLFECRDLVNVALRWAGLEDSLELALGAIFKLMPENVSNDEALQLLICVAENLSQRVYSGDDYDYLLEGDGSYNKVNHPDAVEHAKDYFFRELLKQAMTKSTKFSERLASYLAKIPASSLKNAKFSDSSIKKSSPYDFFVNLKEEAVFSTTLVNVAARVIYIPSPGEVTHIEPAAAPLLTEDNNADSTTHLIDVNAAAVAATDVAPHHDEPTALESVINQHRKTTGKVLSYFFGKETNAQIALGEMRRSTNP